MSSIKCPLTSADMFIPPSKPIRCSKPLPGGLPRALCRDQGAAHFSGKDKKCQGGKKDLGPQQTRTQVSSNRYKTLRAKKGWFPQRPCLSLQSEVFFPYHEFKISFLIPKCEGKKKKKTQQSF